MHTHWIVRMDGPSGRVSAVWDTRRPFTIGQPLRWVVELRNSGRVVRVIDTLQKVVRRKARARLGLQGRF